MDKLTTAINQNDNSTFNTAAFVKTPATDVVPAADDDFLNNGTLKLVTNNPMSPKDAANIKIESVPT